MGEGEGRGKEREKTQREEMKLTYLHTVNMTIISAQNLTNELQIKMVIQIITDQ